MNQGEEVIHSFLLLSSAVNTECTSWRLERRWESWGGVPTIGLFDESDHVNNELKSCFQNVNCFVVSSVNIIFT